MRLGHPQEVSWYCLDGMLFQGGQDAEELVRYRRYGTGLIRPVAAARAELPLHGPVPPRGDTCLRNMG